MRTEGPLGPSTHWVVSAQYSGLHDLSRVLGDT